MTGSPISLLILALGAIAMLVALVTWVKVNDFVALLTAPLGGGIGAGMAPLAALKAFQDGVGATLGGIAAVIALGAMVGKLLRNRVEPRCSPRDSAGSSGRRAPSRASLRWRWSS